MSGYKTDKLLGPVGYLPADAKTGTWRLKRPVIDKEKCILCGICSKYCPLWVIDVEKDEKSITIDYEYCKGCGICEEVCPKSAISMNEEEEENKKEVR